jgi:hypothetical protein
MKTSCFVLVPAVIVTLSACGGEPTSPSFGTILFRIVSEGDALASSAVSLNEQSVLGGSTAARQALDAVRAGTLGPVNLIVDLVKQDSLWVGKTPLLSPGTYDAFVAGLVSGETTHFGRTNGVAVLEGEETVATIFFRSFVPTMDPLSSPTAATSITVRFSGVENADSHVVQLDTSASFTTSRDSAVADSSALILLSDTGTYWIRTRAVNTLTEPGQASEPVTVEIVTDIRPTGNDAASATDLGFGAGASGTIRDVNILPSQDEDWYSLDLCADDNLSVEILAARLDPPSALDSSLEVLDVSESVVGANDDDEGTTDSKVDVLVPSNGTYLVKVFGSNSSLGYYELVVDVVPGANNDGNSCV